VGELRQAAELLREANCLIERPLEPLLSHRHVEAGLPQGVRKRAEGVPIERFGWQLAPVLVDVPRGRNAAELLPELLEQSYQLLARGETPWDQPGLALRPIPAPEVLDHGLWMHGRLRIGRELSHRRRAPQPFCGLVPLSEDQLVGVAFA